MKTKLSMIILAGLFPGMALQAQDDKSAQKMESQQIIIQQNGNEKESISIQIDGDDVMINGKPMNEYEDKNVTIKKRKMIISDGNKVIYDSDNNTGPSTNDEPVRKKAFLGVTSETDEKGARVMSVSKESAAEKAGLIRGDIITKINDTRIDGPEALTEAISQCKPGDQIKIKYIRDGKAKSLKTELGERTDMARSGSPDVRSFSFSMPNGEFRSFTMPEINDSDLDGIFKMPDLSDLNIDITGVKKPKMGLKLQDTEKGNGVKVLEVEENSTSAKAGLKKDDMIVEINDRAVKNTDDARQQLKESNEGDSYKMKIIRDGKEMLLEVSIPRKLKTIDL